MALRPIESHTKSIQHEVEYIEAEHALTLICKLLYEILETLVTKIQNSDERILSLQALRHVNTSAAADILSEIMKLLIILTEPLQLPKLKSDHQDDINDFWIQYHAQLTSETQSPLIRRFIACSRLGLLYQKHFAIFEKIGQLSVVHAQHPIKVSLSHLTTPVQHWPKTRFLFSGFLEQMQSVGNIAPAHLAIASSKQILDELLAPLEQQCAQLHPLSKADLYESVVIKKDIVRLKQYAADNTLNWFRETALTKKSGDQKTILHHVAAINSDDVLPLLQLIWSKLKTKYNRFTTLLHPDILDEYSATPLHHAVLYGSLSAVEYLLEQGANLELKMHRADTEITLGGYNRTDLNGYTPLHCAAHRNHHEIIMCLIQNGANLCAVNTANQRADQIVAAEYRNTPFRPLYSHYLGTVNNINQRTNEIAAEERRNLPFSLLYSQYKKGPNFIRYHANKLQEAIQNNKLSIVHEYATANTRWFKLPLTEGITALFVAIHYNRLDVVKLIVETLAPTAGTSRATLLNTTRAWPEGPTALELAAKKQQKDILIYCVDQSMTTAVNFFSGDYPLSGDTVLHLVSAWDNDNAEIIQFLLSKNKHFLAITDRTGKTPNEIAKKNNSGLTVLQADTLKLAHAIQTGDVTCVYHFAQTNIHWLHIRLNDDQQTALHLAAQFNQTETLKFIVSTLKEQFIVAIKQGDLWMVKYYATLNPKWLFSHLNTEHQTAKDIAIDYGQEVIAHFITQSNSAFLEQVEQSQSKSPDQPLFLDYWLADTFTLAPITYLAYHITHNRAIAERNLNVSAEQKIILQKNIEIQHQLFLQLYQLSVVTSREITAEQYDASIKQFHGEFIARINALAVTDFQFVTLKKIIDRIPSLIEHVGPNLYQSIYISENFIALIENIPQLLKNFISTGEPLTQAKNLLVRLNGGSTLSHVTTEINVARFISKLPAEIAICYYDLILHLIEMTTQKTIDRNASEVQLVEFLEHCSGQGFITHSRVLFFAGQLMQARLSQTQHPARQKLLASCAPLMASSSTSSTTDHITSTYFSTITHHDINFNEAEKTFVNYAQAIKHYSQLWRDSTSCLAARPHVIQLINIHLQSGSSDYHLVIAEFLNALAHELEQTPHNPPLCAMQYEFMQLSNYLRREDQALAWYRSILKASPYRGSAATIEYLKAQWACIHIYIDRGCESMYHPMLNALIETIAHYLHIAPIDQEILTLQHDALQLQKIFAQQPADHTSKPTETAATDAQNSDDDTYDITLLLTSSLSLYAENNTEEEHCVNYKPSSGFF